MEVDGVRSFSDALARDYSMNTLKRGIKTMSWYGKRKNGQIS